MLAKYPSFEDRLPQTCLQELEQVFQTRVATKGEILFAQDAPPKQLFLVRRGCAKVVVDTSCGRGVVAELLFTGDLCGVTCTFLEERYPVSAICVQNTEVATIDKALFSQLGAKYPALWIAGLASCHAKHKQQREMLASMAVETVRQRTIRILLFLASRFGKRIGNEVFFTMPFDRQELSELVGTTGETVIRSLSQLRREGYFSESGATVTLTRPGELAKELAAITGCGGCSLTPSGVA